LGNVGRIFKDDFENGYAPWSGTKVDSGATLEISSTRAKKGAYSSKSICGYGYDKAYAYKTFTPIDTVYARAYAYLEAINTSVVHAKFLSLADQYFNYVSIGLSRYAGVHYISVAWRDSGELHDFTSPTIYPVGSWHCLEIMYKRDAEKGKIRCWFDGVEVAHQTGLDTSGQVVDRVWAGPNHNYFESGGEVTVYLDLVEVSDSYIGIYKPLTLKANPHAGL
jgi:hypothetical protein